MTVYLYSESTTLITSAKEVMFSICLFVCLFVCEQDYAQTTQPIFTQFGGICIYRPRKKRLDFVGNADHVMLWLEVG